MKKRKVEIKPIYALLSEKGKVDICVSFDKDEVDEFHNQIGGGFIIEERQYENGWCDSIKYMDLFLIRINDVLYPKRDISRAENEKQKILHSLYNTKCSVEELMDTCTRENEDSYRQVLKDIQKRYEYEYNSHVVIKLNYDNLK